MGLDLYLCMLSRSHLGSQGVGVVSHWGQRVGRLMPNCIVKQIKKAGLV